LPATVARLRTCGDAVVAAAMRRPARAGVANAACASSVASVVPAPIVTLPSAPTTRPASSLCSGSRLTTWAGVCSRSFMRSIRSMPAPFSTVSGCLAAALASARVCGST
jgi:hypothetical protein